jgi:hypothetical protein
MEVKDIKCEKQFPECPTKVDESCKTCPFFEKAERKDEEEK